MSTVRNRTGSWWWTKEKVVWNAVGPARQEDISSQISLRGSLQPSIQKQREAFSPLQGHGVLRIRGKGVESGINMGRQPR